jgi:xanthine dehydrogenase accessory factor
MIDPGACIILIKGGGDLATGVATRLFRSGFPLVITELAHPLMVRRTVSFGEAVNEGHVQVEGIEAELVGNMETTERMLYLTGRDRVIPVIVDPEARCRERLHPLVIVDAIMAKRNIGTSITDAPFVVALGPGFSAGTDCHAVIETNRGHRLGRVIYEGAAEPDTGLPGDVGGKTVERLLRAPAGGVVEGAVTIGEHVHSGQLVAEVDGQGVYAQIDGVLRGLVHSGLHVDKGLKIGDIDPRAERSHCFLVSDKSLAIGGGVLEAIMSFIMTRTDR